MNEKAGGAAGIFRRFAVLAVSLAAMASTGLAAERIEYEIVEAYPHDTTSFTQGLFFEDGVLFEGTGLVGRSYIRKIRLATGEVLQETALPPPYFGEGIAPVGGRVYQLTWRSRAGFIYDKESLKPVGRFRYPTEGWGLTSDGSFLIMSDGSAHLRFMDPVSFTEVRRVTVHDSRGPVRMLNELEYVDGSIYANVFYRDHILRISPATGAVTGVIDLGDLAAAHRPADPEAILNGIAWDADRGLMLVTGKLWPDLFALRLKCPEN